MRRSGEGGGGDYCPDLAQKDGRWRYAVMGHLTLFDTGFKGFMDLTVLTYKFLGCGSLAFGDAVCEAIDKCLLV